MAGDRGDDPEAQLASYAQALAEGIDRALGPWVAGCVERIMSAHAGRMSDETAAAAAAAAERARSEVGAAVAALLGSDPDAQRSTPLALVRGAVRYPTEVLRAAGVPPVRRDAFAARAFPDDIYDLSPASLADVAPDLAEPGLAWGAAKAFVHRRRHSR